MKKKILVLDDDPDFTRYLGRVAHNDGYEVIAVGSIKDAKAKIKEMTFAAFIIDGELPDGNGLDFFKWLTSNHPEHTRFAFISSGFREAKDFAYLKGELHFDVVLPKPLDLPTTHALFKVLVEEPVLTEDELLLQDLSQSFIEAAPLKVKRLNELIVEYERSGDHHPLAEFAKIIHRLAGTASSFGLGRISEISKALDMRITDAILKSQFYLIEVVELKEFLDELMIAYQFPNWSRVENSVTEELDSIADLVLVTRDPIIIQRFDKLAINHHFALLKFSKSSEVVEYRNKFQDPNSTFIIDTELFSSDPWWEVNQSEMAKKCECLLITREDHADQLMSHHLGIQKINLIPFESNLRYLTWFLYQHIYRPKLVSYRVLVWGGKTHADRLKTFLSQGLTIKADWVGVQKSADIIRNLSPLSATVVLVMDLGGDSLEKIRFLRADERSAQIKIFVVGKDPKREIEALKYGANAYCLAQNPQLIQTMIHTHLILERAISAKINKQGANGVLSFGGFLQRALETFSKAIRQNDRLTIVRMGLRNYDAVKDQLLGVSSSNWLQELGMQIVSQLRLSDIVSIRQEGEFVILLEGANKKDALPLLERIVGDLNLRLINEGFNTKISAGMVSYPEDGTSLNLLLKRSEEVYRRAVSGHEGLVLKWSEAHRNVIHKERGILIIEPDLELGKMLEFSLRTKGWPVQCVQKGDDLFHILAKGFKPILVISERTLPDGDGIDFFKRANAFSESPLKWIFLSSKGSNEDVIAGLKSGARDYIVKPFNLEVLIAKIKNFLEG